MTKDSSSSLDTPLISQAKGDVEAAQPRQQQPKSSTKERIVSLDQLRGFVVLMLMTRPVISYLDAVPPIFKHTDRFFSLADAIMCHFVTMVGFAMMVHSVLMLESICALFFSLFFFFNLVDIVSIGGEKWIH